VPASPVLEAWHATPVSDERVVPLNGADGVGAFDRVTARRILAMGTEEGITTAINQMDGIPAG